MHKDSPQNPWMYLRVKMVAHVEKSEFYNNMYVGQNRLESYLFIGVALRSVVQQQQTTYLHIAFFSTTKNRGDRLYSYINK